MGMKACAREVWCSDSLAGRVVAMQGFGNTGRALADQLTKNEEGVKLIVTDIHEDALARARECGAEVVEPDQIYDAECDILAPCALGGTLNRDTIPRPKCKAIVGSANNQLLETKDADALEDRGILYAPDFIVNADGVINISFEVGMTYSEEAAREKTSRIYETVEQVIAKARNEGTTTAVAAEGLAEERLASVRKVKAVRL